jgi:hypothetical protein
MSWWPPSDRAQSNLGPPRQEGAENDCDFTSSAAPPFGFGRDLGGDVGWHGGCLRRLCSAARTCRSALGGSGLPLRFGAVALSRCSVMAEPGEHADLVDGRDAQQTESPHLPPSRGTARACGCKRVQASEVSFT